MQEWIHTPIGVEPEHWTTWPGCQKVLAVAHTVADAQRLMDPVAVLAADQRVQIVFTVAPHAVFGAGVREWLHAAGTVVVPWGQATQTRFDLALATSVSRELDLLRAPIVLFAHGVGFNKLAPSPEYRRQAVARQTYGLAREGLVRDGQLVAARLALAHTEERVRLDRVCPEAWGSARVVGDAAADRVLASLQRRDWCRRQLGIDPDEKLVVAASTWGPSSLLGAEREVLSRLVGETRGSRCRVALLMHPNVRAAHGTWQVTSWLSSCVEAGLMVVPVSAEWASVLAAADAVVGDHGSTTLYATLLDRPVVMTSNGGGDIDPASPMGEALCRLPQVREDTSTYDQLLRELSTGERDVLASLASRVTSHPGGFAHRVRPVLYELLGIPEPDEPAATRPLRSLTLDIPRRQL